MSQTRRGFLGSLGLLALGGCSMSGSVPASCVDVAGLAEEEVKARTALGYADRATDPTRACKGCNQWIAATTSGACGGCKLMKGPIHPDGSCKAFTPRG